MKMLEVFSLRKRCIVLLCAFVMAFSATNIFALTIALTPREIDLGDGLVFWLIHPDFGHPESEIYTESGLYRDGELVYSVDVSAGWWQVRLFFSDDAMTFFLVSWARGGGSVIRFYDKGVYVRGHGIQGGLFRRGDALFYRDRANNILQVTTAENVIITFDISTGEILSKEMSWWRRNFFNIVYTAVGTACVLGLFYYIKYKKRSKPYKEYDDWHEV